KKALCAIGRQVAADLMRLDLVADILLRRRSGRRGFLHVWSHGRAIDIVLTHDLLLTERRTHAAQILREAAEPGLHGVDFACRKGAPIERAKFGARQHRATVVDHLYKAARRAA